MHVREVSTVVLALAFALKATGQGSPPKQDTKPQATSGAWATDIRFWTGAFAAGKTELPKTLEELLAKALNDNPDLRLAETKVREAEALLNKTRLEVMQKAIKMHQEREVYRAMLKEAQVRFEQHAKLFKTGAVTQVAMDAAKLGLQQAKANLAKVEADMPFLMGSHSVAVSAIAFSPDGRRIAALDPDSRVVLWDALTGKQLQYQQQLIYYPPSQALVVRQQQGAKIRDVLNQTVQGDFEGSKVLDLLREKLKGTNLHTSGFDPSGQLRYLKPEQLPPQPKLHLTEAIPLGAALQWFEDTHSYRFVVRDYGIVLVPASRLPPGAVLLLDVWKHPPEKSGPQKGK